MFPLFFFPSSAFRVYLRSSNVCVSNSMPDIGWAGDARLDYVLVNESRLVCCGHKHPISAEETFGRFSWSKLPLLKNFIGIKIWQQKQKALWQLTWLGRAEPGTLCRISCYTAGQDQSKTRSRPSN
ncbi:hypothetical protein RRG08_003164 [Elysia crispata]|uniref:Uncharacterized protein n=1 Tax=Elysia crispata TaxID=231223 RepID=A0AAE1EBP4_9GAST|nr:hypothetical protein RRG08_003164 [Elysia crispata]